MDFTIDAINKLIAERFDEMKSYGEIPQWKRGYSMGEMCDIAESFCNTLWEFIHDAIIDFPRDAIFYSRPERVGDYWKINVFFDEDALWRDSLYQGEDEPLWRNYAVRNGKYGTDNIVKQFNYGWHSKGQVSGLWHGEPTVSRRSRSGNNMLRRALYAFNDNWATYEYDFNKAIMFAVLVGDYDH